MKTVTCLLLAMAFVVAIGCKEDRYGEGFTPMVTCTVSRASGNSTWTFHDRGETIDIRWVDFELTVNGKAYGKVEVGDEITVVPAGVYRNDDKLTPMKPVGPPAQFIPDY